MKFSIVITTKDRPQFLQRAVQSILNNSILPEDIVLVNDGGESLRISDIAPETDVAINIINNSQSKGANFSRNIGIESTKNDIVFLLDDDDALSLDSFETRLIAFKDPDVGISYTGIKIVEDVELSNVKRVVNNITIQPSFQNLLKFGNVIGSTSRVGIRKSYFLKAGKFDESLNSLQDYDLWLRMLKISTAKFDNNSGVFYTVHRSSGQISGNFLKYAQASEYLSRKYVTYLDCYKLKKQFQAHLYLRVAIAASSSSFVNKVRYAFKSFAFYPNIKALAILIIPTFIMKKVRPYV